MAETTDVARVWKQRLVDEQARLRGLLQQQRAEAQRARVFLAQDNPAAAEDVLAAMVGDDVAPPAAGEGRAPREYTLMVTSDERAVICGIEHGLTDTEAPAGLEAVRVRELLPAVRDEGERDSWPGITRPASRARMGLTKAVVVALEAGVEPASIRRFVDDELSAAVPDGGQTTEARWCEFRWTCPACRRGHALADHPRRDHGPQYCSGTWDDGHDEVRMELVVTPLYVAPSAPVEGDGRSAREEVAFERSRRGFKHYAPIPALGGHNVKVYESSSAEEPRLWLAVEPVPGFDADDGDATAHLTLAAVDALIDTLVAARDNHYQREEDPGA